MEGEIDTAHISFLHSTRNAKDANNAPPIGGAQDPARARARLDGTPRLTLEETPYGFTYGARRTASEDEYYWRVTRWLYPFYSLIPGSQSGSNGRCWVPIDDEHTWTFGYACRDNVPYSQEDRDNIMKGAGFPPRVEYRPYALKDGYIIDSWVPIANRENDYLIDREMQKTVNYTGIWGINEQDRSIQESMGQIVDRSREHLGSTDIAGIAARRLLIKMARDLQDNIEPAIVNDPDAYRVRAIDVVSSDAEFADVLANYHEELGVARM